jgi:8-oxo-dGTP diphosphatase
MKVFNTEIVDVVCAVIFGNDPTKILVGKRKDVDLWELPGGKAEDGESFYQAVAREVKEELDVDYEVFAYVATYVKDLKGKTLNLYMYVGRIYDQEPKALEHTELRWITKNEIDTLEWIETEEMLTEVKRLMRDV